MTFNTKLRLGQINTVDLDSSEFASANSVNSVQSNLSSLTLDVSTISDNVNALPDSAANDYATYTTLSGLIDLVNDNVVSIPGSAANDYITYTTLSGLIDTVNDNVASLPDSAANDYATYTTLSSLINTVNSNVDVLPDSAANDFTTYTTLSSLIDTVNSNVSSLPDSAANDYTTYTTLSSLVNTVQDNVDSLTSTVDSADANLYNTYTSLSSLIDTVQDNVGASSGGNATIIATSDKFTTSTSNQFTLSRSVTNQNDIVVSLSGILQSPGLGYEVSDTTLTLANTLPLQQGIPVEVRHLTGVSGAGSIWQEITTDSLLAARGKVIVDTSSSEVILTLPQSPSLGDEVRIIDGAGNASNNAITLYGNGSNIEADTSNVVVDVDRSAFTMVYYNSYNGWLFGEK